MAWNLELLRQALFAGHSCRRRSSAARFRQAAMTLARESESLEERLVLTITPDEQMFVYLLNQIRHNPQKYAQDANLPVSLDGVQARQPLAVNDDLFTSARFHATEMANNDYFDHQSHVTGDWPNKMARDAGYVLPNYFPQDANNIESIAAGTNYSDPADVIKLLIIDDGIPDLGHRKHLLGIDSFNAQANEIGVGHAFNASSTYKNYWAAHITFSAADNLFLTGVVYDDTNEDGVYEEGEGLPDVTVGIPASGLVTQTNDAGGWSIELPGSGTYTLLVSGGAFVGTASAVVTVDTENREVDFNSGNPAGVIDFGTPPPGANQPPVNTVPAGPLDLQEDSSLAVTGVSTTDPDAANQNVSVTLSVSHGKLQLPTNISGGLIASQITGNNSNQVVITAPLAKINATLATAQGLVYRPNSNYNGTDTLTVLTNDLGNVGTGGALTDTDTVPLQIAAVDDPPVNNLPNGPISVITEVSHNITGLGLSDPDLNGQPAVVTLSVQHGTLTLRTDVASGLTAGEITGNGTNTVTMTASLSHIQNTFQSSTGVAYVSDVGYVGTDTLTMNSDDQGQSGSGGPLTDSDSVTINVQPPPVAPVLSIPGTTVTSAGGLPVIVGAGATLTDTDSPNYNAGKITVKILSGAQSTDKLTLNTVGKKTGQLNLKKDDVKVGKTVIGHVSGGTNGTPLTIQFSTSVTPATVQTVLNNITLRASRKKLLPGTRTLQFVVTDPTHLESNSQTRDVTV